MSESTPDPLATPQLELYRQGAHLTAAHLPAGNPLFLSPSSRFEPGRAIRGGIPLIFPWFGDDTSGADRGAHGFARTAAWREVERSPAGEHVRMELYDTEATRQLWPHAFRASVGVRVGDALEVEFEVTNTGPESFEFEAAMHTYLAVSDVARIRAHGLEGAEYLDKPDGFKAKRQGPDPIDFSAEVDRVYNAAPTEVRIEDPAGPTLLVAKHNAASTIVWNPGPTKGRALTDLGDAWNRFVCVESGNVGSDRIHLAPAASHSMRLTLTLH